MNKCKVTILLSLLMFAVCSVSIAQINENDWSEAISSRSNENIKEQLTFNISVEAFQKKIRPEKQEITLPSPNGVFETYEIKPTQVVAPEVAHLYTIKTFRGYKKDNPTIKIACDISSGGFNAAVYEGEKTYFIEPNEEKVSEVAVFYKSKKRESRIACKALQPRVKHFNKSKTTRDAAKKRIIRLAITASGEFSDRFGSFGGAYSKTNVLNALAAGVNMINPIFSRDVGVEFSLVTDTSLVYTDAATDPFDPSDQIAMIRKNHKEIVSKLGLGGFDIGHLVMWKPLGGVAYKSVMCNRNLKGAGFSGITGSLTTLWVDYVCHELGHQLGADHNFSLGGCNSVRGHRYEPGEGSSIMSYANACPGNSGRYKTSSDPYFHYASIMQIKEFLGYMSCGIEVTDGNAYEPVADAGQNISIPVGTPFVLVGSGEDGNDGTANLTYGWQQFDGGGGETSGAPNCMSTTESMFKYIPPSTKNYRSFPAYEDLMENNTEWEKLPCVARTMTFSLAVRDNNEMYGRVAHDTMQVRVVNTGPFEVIAPNGNEELVGDDEITVEWAVNGTDTHTPTIDIFVTTDGGVTYTLLAGATPNDGKETVKIPDTGSESARILIRSSVEEIVRKGNQARSLSSLMNEATAFYDLSDGGFKILEKSAAALPVELVYFSGEVDGASVLLSWKTAKEENNEGFEIQRLDENTGEWSEVGFVTGNDTSSEEIEYTLADDAPIAGANIYRLKQVDFDGNFEYSDVVTVRFQPQNLGSLFFPNPFTDVIRTSAEEAPKHVKVFDAQGKLTYESKEQTELNLDFLETGMYFLEILNNDGSASYQRLFKA